MAEQDPCACGEGEEEEQGRRKRRRGGRGSEGEGEERGEEHGAREAEGRRKTTGERGESTEWDQSPLYRVSGALYHQTPQSVLCEVVAMHPLRDVRYRPRMWPRTGLLFFLRCIVLCIQCAMSGTGLEQRRACDV
eukprot:1329396-Rhodomonas_salina.1